MKDSEGDTAAELGIEGTVEGDCKSDVVFGFANGWYSSSRGMSSVGLSSASYDSVGCIEGRCWL